MFSQVPFADVSDYENAFGASTGRTAMDLLAASDEIRGYCRWQIWPQVTETITVDGSGTSVLMLPTLNLVDVASVTETWWGIGQTPTTVNITDLEWSAKGMLYRFSGPTNRAGYQPCWTPRLRGVTLTITHGYSDVPASVYRLTLDMARRAAANPSALTMSRVGARQEMYAGRNLLMEEKAVLDQFRRVISV